MSFVLWYVERQLNNAGWPRSKGLFRKVNYVSTDLVDAVVEQGLEICMGLGAGRPSLGARVIADAFMNNPWTPNSTAGLLEHLNVAGGDVARHSDLSPWKALVFEDRMTPFMTEIEWEKQLGSQEIANLWTGLSAKAALWGLLHEDEMAAAFEADNRRFEEAAARNAVRLGIAVPVETPWPSVDDFYQACEDFVTSFESENSALSAIPKALRDAPAVARRLQG